MLVPDHVRFGPFEFSRAAYRVRCDGKVVPLEPKAIDLLALLIDRAPHVVEKPEIFAQLWAGVAVTDNALTRVVAHLRKALDDDAREPRYVETVATRGYRFIAPLEPVADVELPDAARGVGAPQLGRDSTPRASRRVPARVRWTFVAAAVGIAIVIGIVWSGRMPERVVSSDPALAPGGMAPGRFAALMPRQITTGTGYDGYVAFAPDGRSVAFASDMSGAMEIYVQGLAPGSVATPLTSSGRQSVQPAWSPDGQFIAYHEIATNGIWVVPSRGGVARRLVDFGSNPAWSPDGTLVAFESRRVAELGRVGAPGAISNIWVVSPGGAARAVTQVGSPPGPHLSPAWSHDSRSIVFAATAGPGDDPPGLWRVDVSSGALDKIASHRRLNGEFALDHRGRGVYIASFAGLLWLPLDERGHATGEPVPTGLWLGGTDAAQLAISADGKQMAWTVLDFTGHIWKADRRAPAKALTQGRGVRYTVPLGLSDGTIATIGQRRGLPGGIFLIPPGGALRPLADDQRPRAGLHMLPGGRELLYLVNEGAGSFEAIDIDSGKVRRLFSVADLPLPPGLRRFMASTHQNMVPNASFTAMAVTLVADGTPNIWVASLTDGRPDGRIVQRTFEKEAGSFPVWSADGQWLAYQCSDASGTHVCVVGAREGPSRRLTHEPGQSWVNGWQGNEAVLFAANRAGVWNVVSVPLAGGPATPWTDFDQLRFWVRYPRAHQQTGAVLFERTEVTARAFSVNLP